MTNYALLACRYLKLKLLILDASHMTIQQVIGQIINTYGYGKTGQGVGEQRPEPNRENDLPLEKTQLSPIMKPQG